MIPGVTHGLFHEQELSRRAVALLSSQNSSVMSEIQAEVGLLKVQLHVASDRIVIGPAVTEDELNRAISIVERHIAGLEEEDSQGAVPPSPGGDDNRLAA